MSMALESDFGLVARLRVVRERRSLSARIRALLGALLCRFERFEAIRALHGLDDRMLADIGLTRSGIESAVQTGSPIQFDARALRTRDITAR